MSDVPEGILDDAEFYSANNSRWWSTLYRLRAYCEAHGPIPLKDGKTVGYFASGYEYDAAAVAQEFPALIKETEASVVGSKQDIERALSILFEEIPDLRLGVVRHTVDKSLATGVIRSGGRAAERLRALQAPKSKLSAK